MRFNFRTIATALASLGLFWMLWNALARRHAAIVSQTQTSEVIDAFMHAWNGYSKYCMGHDSLHPVSNTCEDDFGGWAVTAIDALSTAIIMRKEQVVIEVLRYIEQLDLGVVKKGTRIQTFEVTIRHLAGMISAWDLLNEKSFHDMTIDTHLLDRLYSQMVRLGDGLACAFRTPTGIPRDWVDPVACETDNGTSISVAGAGSLVLEFTRLADITGNESYAQFADKAEQYLIHPQPAQAEALPGLLGTFINVNSGGILNSRGSWGALSDSFYEYLLKAYIYNSNTFGEYLARWEVAADSTISFLASHPYGHPELTFLSSWDGAELSKRMDSLSWFTGGNFILGGMVTRNQTLVDFGLSIADTAGAMYASTATGLGGEWTEWTTICRSEDECQGDNTIFMSSSEFRLRPEALESWYYAYRATRDAKYRDWAWSMFKAINKFCKTDSGFSSISDVDAVNGGGKINMQESFVFAEIFKYLFLIFSEDDTLPGHVQDSRTGKFNEWVFNTEAHPLRVAGPPV